jgi:hypothetical protein
VGVPLRRPASLALVAALATAAAVPGCTPDRGTTGEPTAEYRTDGGVEFSARTALLGSYPVRLRTTATVANRGTRHVSMRFPDGCIVLVRAFTRQGELRWDQGHITECSHAIVEVSLAPGDSATFETLLTAPEVLGDSLPDDVYVLAAYLRPLDLDTIVLQAGRANLVAPRHP